MSFLKSILILVFSISLAASRRPVALSTWTVVAADPASGAVGVAGASCVTAHADAIAALVPGKGVAVVQALWDRENRDKVYQLIQAGDSATEIIRRVTDRRYDNGVQDRQYGVVTINRETAKVAAFTGEDAFDWAGSEQDPDRAVTVQGNILAGAAVVGDAIRAFRSEDLAGLNNLSDRLMRALEAGSAAGGDTRCNSARMKQTATAAFILVARGGDKPYVAVDLGVTDQGKAAAPWLAISVVEPRFGRNPVGELRKKYEIWRRAPGI